jgi:hypothetical protein
MTILGLLSQIQIVPAFRPVDLQTADNNGDWVSLKGYAGCLVLFHSAIGTAGDDPTLKLQQATVVAGSDAKDLAFTQVYTKQAATNLLSTGQWTAVTQAAATSYTNATAAEQEALWAIDVPASMLDVENGFCCLQASVADVGGNAQLGACYYLLYGARFPDAPENMKSAIVD